MTKKEVMAVTLVFSLLMGALFYRGFINANANAYPEKAGIESGFGPSGGVGGGIATITFAPPWGFFAWLEGLWQQAIQDGWNSSTGNPPSGCCGGGGGGGFGGDGPTTYPNNGRRQTR
jgi:hypothetical protein